MLSFSEKKPLKTAYLLLFIESIFKRNKNMYIKTPGPINFLNSDFHENFI